MDNFTPVRVELPLEPLEAFRLASFGIEYVPQYADVMMDPECARARWFYVAGDTWVSQGGYAANLSAFKRFYNAKPWYEQHLGSPGRQLLMD